jgi:chromosomal replication initiator protein
MDFMHEREGSVVSESTGEAVFSQDVFGELRKRLDPERFETWFGSCRLLRLGPAEAEFAVPNGFVRDRLTRQFSGLLEEVVTSVGGGPRSIRISVAGQSVAGQTVAGQTVAGDGTSGVRGARRAQEVVTSVMDEFEPLAAPLVAAVRSGGSLSPYVEGELNTDYVFEQFVVGGCNKLAHAAAMAIGANPGRAYNPFFVHGSVGLGKTHLLQAICHAVKRRNPDMRVLYLSCEEFTNRFGQACREKAVEAFRSYHRAADLLVVDDVEFLAEKSRTQEEFFHTFNALYNQQRQIVLSSDRPPAEIPTLQERLVSRFRWGFVTDMLPPDFETRVAIVKHKASMQSLTLDPAVAQFIAERFDANIRELEGAVVKVLATAAITERDITIELAEESLQGLAPNRNSKATLEDIIGLITSEFPISARDLTGRSRSQMVSLPRQIGMYLARALTEHSLEEVGRFFGNRDHTTVLYAVQKIKGRIKKDRMFSNLIQSLYGRLNRGLLPQRG